MPKIITNNGAWEIVWQRQGNYSVRTAADEFARTYWQAPRSIRAWTPTPGGVAVFKMVDGNTAYRARVLGGLFIVERLCPA